MQLQICTPLKAVAMADWTHKEGCLLKAWADLCEDAAAFVGGEGCCTDACHHHKRTKHLYTWHKCENADRPDISHADWCYTAAIQLKHQQVADPSIHCIGQPDKHDAMH